MEDNRNRENNGRNVRRPQQRSSSEDGQVRRSTSAAGASMNGQVRRSASAAGTSMNGQVRRGTSATRTSTNGQARRSASTAGASANGQTRRVQGTQQTRTSSTSTSRNGRSMGTQGTQTVRRSASGAPQSRQVRQDRQTAMNHNTSKRKPSTKRKATSQKANKKKRGKIILFITEILVLLLLLVVFWGVMQARKIKIVTIDDENVEINEQVKESTENGTLKGYRNIALFGVDSREGELDKNTRTDTIKVVSINLDTKEVKMISLYRDTYVNLSTDTYNKANAAYAKGGPKQAISMLNMNMDLNITDFVTIGFDGLIDVIDAVGGVEIDVQQNEIEHLNNYQISMAGKQDGTVNAKGEPNYVATPGVDYTPVTSAGLQTLNGLQATAYCRIRYVGNDFARAERQNVVLKQVAKKAMTLNPATLNKIAEAVFPKVATSLELNEIIELLGGLTSYKIGETAGFPFEGNYQTGRVNKMSCVIPQDLQYNVTLLHEFLFGEENYDPSDTVKTCSQKIASDTGIYR